MNIIHIINGINVEPPTNYEELSIELNFDNDTIERTASVTRFTWFGESAEILINIAAQGLTGGVGVFGGVTHTIDVTNDAGARETLLNGYIDLTSSEFGNDEAGNAYVSADTIPKAEIDWINEVGDGFTFEYLYEQTGELSEDDEVYVPYVISSIPNYTDSFLVILTLTFVILEIRQLITDLTNKTTESATYIDSVGGVVGLVFKIIWGILLLVTIVELLLDLADLIIQKVKYHPAMSVNRQIEAACSHLGLTYKSSILQSPEWDGLHIMPERFSNPDAQSDSRVKGFFKPDSSEQHGYFNGTFGDMLRGLKVMFNARVVVVNGEFRFEPRLKNANSGTFKMPQYYNPEFRLNADKVVSNYVVDFRYDTTDKNTIDSWKGNNVQVQLEHIVSPPRQLSLLKGFSRQSIPFARGFRKNNLNSLEKIADTLLDSLDPFIGSLIKIGNAGIRLLNFIFDQINKVTKALRTIGIKIDFDLPEYELLEDPNLGDLIDNRIGMLKLESDYFTVPKILLLKVGSSSDNTKIRTDNQDKINARYLYENFHNTNSFAPSSKSAQRYVYNYLNVELNLVDFKKIQDEQVVKLPSGSLADVISCKWNPSTRLADMEVEERRIYDNNLREKIIEPTGR